MNLDKTNAAGSTLASAIEEPLSYAQFSTLLAQYKRAMYESIYQCEDPIALLLKQSAE